MADREHWHLNKGVPVALILTIAIQSMSAIWWAATVSSTLSQIDDQVAENKSDIKLASSVEPRLVKVETDITYIRDAVDENKKDFDKLDAKLTELLREARSTR